jgi:alpha-amylase/alpha-mannosidase (GH57 family)
MDRFVCIHGHFYQPPRENPWLEEVELQDAARPHHDWNERVTGECYRPNASARILDRDHTIIDIVNNYERMSFNFGPTLLSWMERRAPEVYRAVLDADRAGSGRFGGHGPAMAQCYNHPIMPLAGTRDKRTQVRWDIADFERRFGRSPEGMWLPETAVDLETLEVLAEHGIAFTVLAPSQARRVRPAAGEPWREVPAGRVDTTAAYRCPLPSGKSIAVFFYDGPVSHDISFGSLLEDGGAFAGRLAAGFAGREGPALVHVATDGETYGHHHRFGDMALAYCLYHLESQRLARITVYGEYLELFPPRQEVQIAENSSWSCPHGVERWRGNCGCRTGRGGPEWTQAWRAPLRESLDWLRGELDALFEREGGRVFGDPWEARDRYIQVVLDRSPENVECFLAGQGVSTPGLDDRVQALRLLEMQRQALLMYTSCGWFFDEISDIETTQVLKYAARAMQLAGEIGGGSLEDRFMGMLERAPSNRAYGNGSRVYRELVLPARIALQDVAAHHAIVSLFEDGGERRSIYCFDAEPVSYQRLEAGTLRLALGKTRVASTVTWHRSDVSFAVLHLGDHNLVGGAWERMDGERSDRMHREIRDAFKRSDIPQVIRLIDGYFGSHGYTLKNLFTDEQRRILERIIRPRIRDIEDTLIEKHDQLHPFLQALRSMGVPLPRVLAQSAGLATGARLRMALEAGDPDPEQLAGLVEELRDFDYEYERLPVELAAGGQVTRQLERLLEEGMDLARLRLVNRLLEILADVPVGMDLGRSQNIYFRLCNRFRERFPGETPGEPGGGAAGELLEELRRLGGLLNVRCL